MSFGTGVLAGTKQESGQKCGVPKTKPNGTIQASKFDKNRSRIEELLGLGLSARKIANLLGYTNHNGLNTYIKRRRIRDTIPSVG